MGVDEPGTVMVEDNSGCACGAFDFIDYNCRSRARRCEDTLNLALMIYIRRCKKRKIG